MSAFPDRRVAILDNVLDAVGQTPCIRLNRVPKKYGVECEVVAKCECFNPGGSVKDRIAKLMFQNAQASGRMKPGDTVVEATSGNTGIGMSMAAAVMGYHQVIVMPTKMSHEKEVTIKTLGAEVIRTPMVPFDHYDSLISVSRRLEKEKGFHLLDQYKNPSNPDAHAEGTAQEIYEQCGGKVDMVVVGTGTGGTISGIASHLKKLLPNVIIVGVDPHGSILADPTAPAEDVSYQVEGIGYDFIPDVCDRSLIDRWVKSSDKESFELALAVHRDEGILCGGSCGSALWGVVQEAKTLRPDQRCVVVFPDNVRNYMTKFIDESWRIEKGFQTGTITRPTYQALEIERDALKAKIAELEAKAKQ